MTGARRSTLITSTRLLDGAPRLLTLLLVLLATSFGDAARSSSGYCPLHCNCRWRDGKEYVQCRNSSLIEVPSSLDPGTQVLDLTGNSINLLTAEVFSERGLLNLQRLFLANTQLGHVDKRSFGGLINLVELDLCHNHLRVVPSDALVYVHELRELKLSHNPIQRIGPNALSTVPELFRLEMSHCTLKEIDVDAFRGLVKLQWLTLDHNSLVALQLNTLMPLNSIRELQIHANPWSCDCRVRYLKEWLEQVNPSQAEDPLCAEPLRLTNAPFRKITLDQFSCLPIIRKGVRAVNAWKGDNVTMSCSVSASPEAVVTWLWRGRVIGNDSVMRSTATRYLVFNHGRQEKTSLLIIAGVHENSAGRYACEARNSAGSVSRQVLLSVSGRKAVTHVTLQLDSGILVGIFVAVSITGVLFCICLCVLCVRLRKTTIIQAEALERSAMKESSSQPLVENHVNSNSRRGPAETRAETAANGVPVPVNYSVKPVDITDNTSIGQPVAISLDSRKTAKSTVLEVGVSPQHPPAAFKTSAGNHSSRDERVDAIQLTKAISGPNPINKLTADISQSDTRRWLFDESTTNDGSAKPPFNVTSNQHKSSAVTDGAPSMNTETIHSTGSLSRYQILPRQDLFSGHRRPPIGTETLDTSKNSLPRRSPLAMVTPLRHKPNLSSPSEHSDSLVSTASDEATNPRRAEESRSDNGDRRRRLPRAPYEPTSPVLEPAPTVQRHNAYRTRPYSSRLEAFKEGDYSSSRLTYRNKSRFPSLPNSPTEDYRTVDVEGGYVSEYTPSGEADTSGGRCNPYLYHVVQLDRYLQEYESLQDRFSRMKTNCESLGERVPHRRSLPTVSLTDDEDLYDTQGAARSYSLRQTKPKLKPILKHRGFNASLPPPSRLRKSQRFATTNDYFSYQEG